ncbi:unnamed protein product [marine sediment metagenome]|uniref:Uncharacterized protein n=1 Tax=marine sediment metagenome TaxID=412755 RepID=X1UUS2_9ZZZZ
MKVLPIEPKDEKKSCFTRSYICWFTEAGMFKQIMKDAKQNNLKIVGYEDKLFNCMVTFQEG